MGGGVSGHAWSRILLIAIGVLGGVGDVWVYRWARSDRSRWLVAACLAHGASVVLFGLLLKWDARAFSSAFMLTSVVHVVLVIAADVAIFEGRPSLTEWAGMALATIAIILLETGRATGPADIAPRPSVEANPDPGGDHP